MRTRGWTVNVDYTNHIFRMAGVNLCKKEKRLKKYEIFKSFLFNLASTPVVCLN